MGPTLLVIALIAASCTVDAKKYKTTRKTRAGMINVHLVPHTHDDVGWLKTVDQYFMGLNDTIQLAGVQYTLDTVTNNLARDPSRTFLYIEQGFFQRWWREASAEDQAKWKTWASNGQIEFGNGGWSMHDEAAPHWAQMVDNTYYGHKFLVQEFGVQPRVGWQIDPFGHSSTQAWLLSAEAGFDALYFGRMDFEDRAKRINESNMEFVWRASQSLGAPAQVFTGGFQSGNYGPPSGLCFDIYCRDGQIQDDERLEDYNVDYYVQLAVNRSLEMYNHSKPSGHIMWKMGSDFQYRNADEWFKNLDKLIHHGNLKSEETGVHFLYSTPSQYTDALNAAGMTYSVKTDDFFPYRDNPHGAWTGYFTSRPALKGYVRVGGNVLRAASLADVATGGDSSRLQTLWEAVGVTQHHDAVSGTAKQHVTFDYGKRISRGILESGVPAIAEALSKGGGPAGLVYCPRVNESACDPAQSATSAGFTVVAYNWLARPRDAAVKVPIPDGWTGAEVTFANGSAVPGVTVLPNAQVPFRTDGAKNSVGFVAPLPSAGFSTFVVKPASARQPSLRSRGEPAPASGEGVPPSISNGLFRVDFDTSTGAISRISNLASGVNTTFRQEWLWYNSSAGGNHDGKPWGNTGGGPNSFGQNSGAYIFRPNTSTAFPVAEAASAEVVADGATAETARDALQAKGRMDGSRPARVSYTVGAGFTEVHQVFTDWLSQTVRLVEGKDYAEIEATVGPIPIDGGLGREVITRFTTDVASRDTFYTDSNGREFLERRRDFRPTYNLTLYNETVTDNYYPVDAAIGIQDASRRLTVLTDRSQAGGSLTSGQVELMAHRRLQHDDSRGVGEPLNETNKCQYNPFKRLGHGLVIRTTYRVMLDKPSAAATSYRPLLDEVFAEPIVMFGSASAADAAASSASLLASGLNWPVNAHLANLDAWGNGSVIVRVTHPFQEGEGPLAAPVTVDLADLFPSKTIAKAVETTLTANRPLSELHRLVWKTADGQDNPVGLGREPIEAEDADGLDSVPVTLSPQQFRTFMVSFTAGASA